MAASPTRCKVNLDWIESEIFEQEDPAPYLEHVHGILVPGGFGERGSEGKIQAATLRARAQACRISASASACRWRDRGGAQPRRHRRAPAPPSSARPRSRSSA